MGGDESGVGAGTKDLFLESAFFSPSVIAGKSFSLGFGSDSAYRFERGVDFSGTRNALERATRLVLDICGGKNGAITELKGQLPLRNPISLRLTRARRVLGIDLEKQTIVELLQRLQFSFSGAEGIFSVKPPPYRFDLGIEADLIEELARIYGYDRIPAAAPKARLPMLPEPETRRTLPQVRQILTSREYQEVINYSFLDPAWEHELADNQQPVALKNPLSSQMAVMRSSLSASLIANLEFNLNRKQTRVRLFEIGCCFQARGDTITQQEKLGGLCYGDALAEQWGAPTREVDFYDVKADIEALFWPRDLRVVPTSHPALHPGKSGQIRLGDRSAGYIGELHPRWRQKIGLLKSVVLFELEMDILMERDLPKAAEISKYPPIRRDVAVVVSDNVVVQTILDRLRAKKIPLISEVHLFDVYRGKGMEVGKKSLAFRMLLQDTEKTLTDAEADRTVSRLLSVLENEFGAVLRDH
jgi:phenylalanyl-tRNA synthetase beta chain